MAPSNFQILYAVAQLSSHARLWRSVDGGETWKAVNRSQTGVLYGDLEVDAADPDKLYGGAFNGIRVSRNGGRSFKLFNEPLEKEKRDTYRLWIDPTQPGLVFASPSTGGLFVRRFE